jgi:hypothetical protein
MTTNRAKEESTGKEPWLTLVPAYGRDYSSPAEVLFAWKAEKDFVIQDVSSPWNGKYVNRQQVGIPGVHAPTVFKIRFMKLRNFVLIRHDEVIGKSEDEDSAHEDTKDFGSDL